MWFYFALLLLAGLLLQVNIYVGVAFTIIVIMSYYIKLHSFKKVLFGSLFILIGYIIFPNVNAEQLESFNRPTKNNNVIQRSIEFTDKVDIDGDLFKGIAKLNSKDYLVYYTIKTEQEKKQLLNNSPLFKNCYASFNINQPLPNTNGLKFNYNEYLKQQEIAGVLKINRPFFTTCKKRDLNIVEEIQQYREQLILKLKQLDNAYIDDIIALTLGETRYLSSDRMDQLKHIGIYHLYAVSGSHVALISVFLFTMLLKLNIRYHHAESIIFMLLPIYAILTGLSPSVLRAVAVVMAYIIIKRFSNLCSLQILSITFISLVIYDAFIIFDIGFQLSYLVSTFLLLSAPIIKDFHMLYKMFSINFISQISSFIILIFHFNTFQWLGFITNFFFIPWFEIILFPLVMIFLMSFTVFGYVPEIMSRATEILLSYSILFIERISALTINDLVVKNLNSFIYFIIFITTTCMCVLVLKKQVIKAIILFIITIFCISFNYKQDSVLLKFLDIGQGDAMLAYHLDSQQVVMIDTGGKVETVKRKKWQIKSKELSYTDSMILPELHEKGYNKIDYLIISHPHMDHMGELLALSKKVTIQHLIINKQTWDSKELKMILTELKNGKTKIIDSRNLNTLNIGKSLYKFYNQNSPNHTDKNETSIITEIDIFNRKVLTAGDATINNELSIMNHLKTNYDILKVGHHGSLTSTSESFLTKVNPKRCVISAGRGNRYRLPNDKTVRNLKQHACEVLNTQEVGGIQFTINKQSMELTTGLTEYNKKAYKNQ
nr:DNA internalization-related competence protein ComEC/Rec2 [Mammaliicoccus sp. Marseille-Q6498]